jgi:mRNA interferase RelE/StbE
LALEIKLTGSPFRYVQSLDKPTRKRIKEKLEKIAEDPLNPRISYPLTGNNQKRSARVGTYRILFEIDDKTLTVADIGPRGQIYRKLSK